jgi:hypothetical protein
MRITEIASFLRPCLDVSNRMFVPIQQMRTRESRQSVVMNGVHTSFSHLLRCRTGLDNDSPQPTH